MINANKITEYNACNSCPRLCGINRAEQKGFCGETQELKIAWAGLHFGEEPPITAKNGSGTVFISGCNLRCAFCQNYQISQQEMGKTVDSETFVSICLALQKAGAENINLVTASHVIPAVAQYLTQAKKSGLTIPICWNSSAYETVKALELLDADIWLPDLKTLNPIMSQELFAARDYPTAAKKSILHMIKKSPLTYNKTRTKLLSGVIIRHLILPNRLGDTQAVLEWFCEHAKEKALLSLMTQYTPVNNAVTAFSNRYVNQAEFDAVQKMLSEYGISNGFYQELVQDSSWLPDFNLTQPFSSLLAKPIWHWKSGFC